MREENYGEEQPRDFEWSNCLDELLDDVQTSRAL
jgi:hypothetical protein